MKTGHIYDKLLLTTMKVANGGQWTRTAATISVHAMIKCKVECIVWLVTRVR